MKLLGTTPEELMKNAPDVYEDTARRIQENKDEPGPLTAEDWEGMISEWSPYYMAETVADLDLIESSEEDPNDPESTGPLGGYLSISKAAGSYDICQWICDDKYVHIWTASGGGEGTVYLIPRDIALNAPTVLESIERTREAWE